MTLALKYRPRRFDDIVGQRHIRPILKVMVRNDDMPPALLFTGSRGTGKTTTARIVAAGLNCDRREELDAPCAECPPCQAVANGTSLDVIEVDAASNGLVSDIRAIKETVQYAVGGRWRVVLLDESHSMSKEASNAVLKTLEEPPPRTLFVLLTTEPGKILDTIVSRAMGFDFRRIPVADIQARLRFVADAEAIKVSDELLAEIASRAQGGMRDAIMTLDQISKVGIQDVESFHELMGITNAAEMILGAAIAGDKLAGHNAIEEHFLRTGDAAGMTADLTCLVRDMIAIRAGGTPQLPAPNLERRQKLAARVTDEQLVAAIRVLWDLKGRTRYTDNDQRAAMDMAFVLICDAIHRDSKAAPTNGNGHKERKLSLEELRAMVIR